MPELTYLTKMATLFKKMERVAIGTDENVPGYISAQRERDSVVLALNTAMLPHGAAAEFGVKLLAERLRKYFGDDAVRLEQPDDPENLDLGTPPAYRLTLTLPDEQRVLEQLGAAHRDIAIEYCQTALKGQTEDQLEFLASQLGERQAAIAFARMTGVEMRYREPAALTSGKSGGRAA